MVNIDKLKGKMVERRYTIESLAKTIGLDKSTLYRRLNEKGESFSIREASEIAKVLELTNEEAIQIFFAEKIA